MLISVSAFWLTIFSTAIATLIFLGIVVFLLHSYGGLKLFIDRDKHITDTVVTNLSHKYPLVEEAFIRLPRRQQLVENNHELKKHDLAFLKYDEELDAIKRFIGYPEEEHDAERFTPMA